jgi:sarcosine oxidase, subunit beta
MGESRPEIVICGAGMAGVAAAYHLSVRQGIKQVLLVDERPPLTLTSDKGTQAYRNWWPGPDDTMVRFINRSIDLLEELAQQSDNCFQLNRRGYIFLTARADEVTRLKDSAQQICASGAGPLRIHQDIKSYIPSPITGFANLPTGADLITDAGAIRQLFPFLCEDVLAMLHVRRAGWLNAKTLGNWLLQEFLNNGGRLIQDRVAAIELNNNRIDTIKLASGDRLQPGVLVVAAGPHLKQIGLMMGLELPVVNELHGKITFPDQENIFSADAPLMIWNDPVELEWTDDERREFANNDQTNWLLEQFPAGVHVRPKGDADNLELMIIWTYERKLYDQFVEPQFNRYFGETLLRGLAKMIPGLKKYFGQRAYVDGGYYCKTGENRPLIGRLPVEGAFVIGALSGFGVMGSQAAAELLAAHITGSKLPDYAPMFQLERYQDPNYQKLLARLMESSGQL